MSIKVAGERNMLMEDRGREIVRAWNNSLTQKQAPSLSTDCMVTPNMFFKVFGKFSCDFPSLDQLPLKRDLQGLGKVN